jgi:hypothetical protein
VLESYYLLVFEISLRLLVLKLVLESYYLLVFEISLRLLVLELVPKLSILRSIN